MGKLKAFWNTAFGKRDKYEEYDDDYYDDDDEVYEEEAVNKPERTRFQRTSRLSYNNDRAYTESVEKANITKMQKQEKICVERRSPKNLDEAAEVCQLINENRVIIVDVTNVTLPDRQRVADFISGVTHALDGQMCQLREDDTNIFMVGSRHVDFGWNSVEANKLNYFRTAYR